MPIKDFQSTDPADFAKLLPGQVIVKPVTFTSATQTLGVVPANSLITGVRVIRTTKWSAAPTFEVGKAGDTGWLVNAAQANVAGAVDSGEAGAAEVVAVNKVVTADTPIVLTLNQGSAAAGAGFVVIEYVELSR